MCLAAAAATARGAEYTAGLGALHRVSWITSVIRSKMFISLSDSSGVIYVVKGDKSIALKQ